MANNPYFSTLHPNAWPAILLDLDLLIDQIIEWFNDAINTLRQMSIQDIIQLTGRVRDVVYSKLKSFCGLIYISVIHFIYFVFNPLVFFGYGLMHFKNLNLRLKKIIEKLTLSIMAYNLNRVNSFYTAERNILCTRSLLKYYLVVPNYLKVNGPKSKNKKGATGNSNYKIVRISAMSKDIKEVIRLPRIIKLIRKINEYEGNFEDLKSKTSQPIFQLSRMIAMQDAAYVCIDIDPGTLKPTKNISDLRMEQLFQLYFEEGAKAL